jgi:hypothetical protein
MRACVRWLAVLWFSIVTLAHAQEIVTLSTRVGATQSYFLAMLPKSPKAVGVLFPGDLGLIHLRKVGDQIKFEKGNFLMSERIVLV